MPRKRERERERERERVRACVRVCVCVVFFYANSISIIGRVLSEKVTGNQVVRFVLNLGCLSENKMDRQSTDTRHEVAFVLL